MSESENDRQNREMRERLAAKEQRDNNDAAAARLKAERQNQEGKDNK